MQPSSRRIAWYTFVLLVLVLINSVIILYAFRPNHRVLTVSFLDVGQGDALLIESPTGVQMLIDGGPDRSVLRQLSREVPPWDRTLDVVIETHPDKDHIAGLGDVLERYQVRAYLESGIPDATPHARHVAEMVEKESGVAHTIVRRGMRLHLGGGVYADVLYPDRDQSQQKETNEGSIVLQVRYGETSFMFTGDLGSPSEDYLVALDEGSGRLRSDVLKAGHHGSRHSTDSLWLAAVDPKIVVISAGEDNSYGHPHAETVERIRQEGAAMVSTIEGTVTFVSDGKTVVRE